MGSCFSALSSVKPEVAPVTGGALTPDPINGNEGMAPSDNEGATGGNNSSQNVPELVTELFKLDRSPRDSKGAVTSWRDSDFPPDRSSLCRDWNSLSDAKQESLGRLEWRRLSELPGHPEGGLLFADAIAPGDVLQGTLGNCYFLSSLAVLAEKPARVERLFVQDSVTANGQYAMQLCIDGRWRQIEVDDMVPFDPRTNRTAFAQPRPGAELWVCLLEKAWAKIKGDYQSSEGGNPVNAMTALTGCASTSMNCRQDGPFLTWDKLKEADVKHWMACVNTPEFRQDVTPDGLVSGHAYAVLGTHDLSLSIPGSDVRLVKIRNPWGRVEWKGEWSDGSPKWTPEIEKAVGGLKQMDDGVFFMSIEELCTMFTEVCICHVHDYAAYKSTEKEAFVVPLPNSAAENARLASRGSVLRSNRYACVKLMVTRSGEFSIGLHQDWDKVNHGLAMRFTVLPMDGSEKHESKYIIARSVYLRDLHLDQGQYAILVYGSVPDNGPKPRNSKFSVSVSGDDELLRLDSILSGSDESQRQAVSGSSSEWNKLSQALAAMYRDQALRSQDTQISNFAQWGHKEISLRFWAGQNGIAVFLYQNKSTSTSLEQTLSLKLENMASSVRLGDCQPTDETYTSFQVRVGPGQDATILAEQIDSRQGFRYGYSTSATKFL